MLVSRPFHGVRSVEELAHVMAGYDVGSEWPPGSGQSYTAGLAPAAWAQGFRMTDGHCPDARHDRLSAAMWAPPARAMPNGSSKNCSDATDIIYKFS
jgi:hypothetical protein